MADTESMPEGVTRREQTPQEAFQTKIQNLTEVTQLVADNTEEGDELLREEISVLREMKGVSTESKKLEKEQVDQHKDERRHDLRRDQQKEEKEDKRTEKVTGKLSEGFSKVTSSVGQMGSKVGEQAMDLALGPMKLVTEPLKDLGIDLQGITQSLFTGGMGLISRGVSGIFGRGSPQAEEPEVSQTPPQIQEPSVTPDDIEQPSVPSDDIEQPSVTPEVKPTSIFGSVDEDEDAFEDTSISTKESVRPERVELLQQGAIGAMGVYLGDIFEESGEPSVERDDEGIMDSVTGALAGAKGTALMGALAGKIGAFLTAALPVAVPLILGGVAAYGLSKLSEIIFNVDREALRREIEDRQETTRELEETHGRDFGAIHDVQRAAERRISESDFEPYDPMRYAHHLPTVAEGERPFQDVEIPEEEIEPLHPAAILSEIGREHPDSLAMIETHAREGDFDVAREEFERAARRVIPEPVVEASDPSQIVPFLRGEEVRVPEHPGMGDADVPREETFVGWSVQDFQDFGFPFDVVRDDENRRLLIEMSRRYGIEGTRERLMEYEPEGSFFGLFGTGLGNAFDAFLESGEASQYVDDAIIRPDGEVIHTHPDDTIVATQNDIHHFDDIEGNSLDREAATFDTETHVELEEGAEIASLLEEVRDAIIEKPFNNNFISEGQGSPVDFEGAQRGRL